MNKKQQTIQTYNDKAQDFAHWWTTFGPCAAEIDKVLSFANKQNPFVFELGCGDGRDAEYIVKKTNKYLGIDASKQMIELARQRLPDTNFLVEDFEESNFPENADIIFAFASLLHSNPAEIRKILMKSAKSLNNEGLLFMTLQHKAGREETRNDQFGTRTFYYYSPEIITELAKEYFDTIEISQGKPPHNVWFSILLKKRG